MLDSTKVKTDFPILKKNIHGQSQVYLDSAATSHKPQAVIDAISNYYTQHNSNVHRGVHQLSEESTDLFEAARQTIADFFGAEKEELILTRNTTEATNGAAYGWAVRNLKKGDVILTSLMEHHSNFVVWQEVCRYTGAELKYVQVTPEGRLDLKDLEKQLKADPVKLLALVHVSNTTGTINPISQIKALLKKHQPKARLLLDGAQSAPHMPINFKKLGADFFAFSGHKMLGPMGVGGLLVKKELLESNEMSPWLFGGGMIDSVKTTSTEFNIDLNERYIAGTPDVASTVGLAAACGYLSKLGMDQVMEHDQSLVTYAVEKLSQIPEIKLIGPIQSQGGEELDRLGSVAWVYEGVHAHDVAQVLDSEAVAVRSGHHCTMPLHLEFGWQATTRASFNVYNTTEDIDRLVAALKKVKRMFLS